MGRTNMNLTAHILMHTFSNYW